MASAIANDIGIEGLVVGAVGRIRDDLAKSEHYIEERGVFAGIYDGYEVRVVGKQLQFQGLRFCWFEGNIKSPKKKNFPFGRDQGKIEKQEVSPKYSLGLGSLQENNGVLFSFRIEILTSKGMTETHYFWREF